MLQLVQSIRDLREFIAAKKRKREPIRWSARGATAAAYVPQSARGFANFCAALRLAADWGQASERLDELAHALRARHACELPTPRKVLQNSDRSLTLFWQGLTVRAFPDQGITVLLGGTTGAPVRGVTTDVLDMLAFQARLQNA